MIKVKKIFFSLFFAVVFLFSFCVAASADSLLVNTVSHADTEPVLDAAVIPDSIYGETEIMYIRNPLLDDVPLEDLSEFSGSFYTIWREGKLYFHFTLKNFSDEDKIVLYFDLEDSNAESYGAKTLSVLFGVEDGSFDAAYAGEYADGADVDSFNENISIESSVSGNSYIVETVLDFSKLYDGFSFGSGKRVGFDIVVFDKVEGGVVRYSWNDDTGVMMTNPDNLGTFVMGIPSVSEVEPDEIIEPDDGNPGTSDSGLPLCAFICFAALLVGTAVSCRIKI